MFIYNVTIKINWAIHDEWLQWLKEVHAPEVKATGCFSSYTIVRLREIDEEEGPTYAVQYFADSKSHYNRYISNYAAEKKQASFDKWGNNFMAFRTLMEIVH